MNKIGIGIAALVCVGGIVYGATLQTAGNQEKSKMGNSTLVDIVNANDVALNAELANAVTNVSVQSVSIPAGVTNATLTLQTVSLTDSNGVTALCLTNVALTLQSRAAITVATNVVLQRR
jgi:hypothetical protein